MLVHKTAVALLDVDYNAKNNISFSELDVRPIWRRFAHDLLANDINLVFLKANKNGDVYLSNEFEFILIHIDNYIPEWFYEFIEGIKLKYPSTKIFFCGFLPSIAKDKINSAFPNVEVIEGPLEKSLSVFLSIVTQKKEYISPDINNYHYLKCTDKYSDNNTFALFPGSYSSVQASAGCPMACSFCRFSSFYRMYLPLSYYQFPIEYTLQEIEEKYKKYNIKHFKFADSNFLGTKKTALQRAVRLNEEINKRGLNISFEIHCRSDLINEEVLQNLVSAGLRHLDVGIESMSESQLKRFSKGETPEDHIKVAKLSQSFGITMQGSCILADPLVTRDEMIESLEGLYKISKTVLLLFNERMILYNTIPYFRRYGDLIIEKKPIPSFMDGIFDYKFNDPWCDENISLIERTTSYWKKELRALQQELLPGLSGIDLFNFVKYATRFLVNILLQIVKTDKPRDDFAKELCNQNIQKLRDHILNSKINFIFYKGILK